MKDIHVSTTPPLPGLTLAEGVNEGFDSLQKNIAGVLSKSVAGGAGTTALTADECYNKRLVFTGALTGNRVVTVPDSEGFPAWEVLNLTTGAYTLTLKTATGSGFVLPSGIAVPAFSDGAAVISVLDAINLYRRSNILGTVSQSGGVPTGAIIEKGSNANGEYTRWADGTQICRSPAIASGSMTSTSGALFTPPSNKTWTYPAAFVSGSIPSISASAIRTAGSGVVWVASQAGVPAVGNTSAAFRELGTTSGAEADSYITAIGRWF